MSTSSWAGACALALGAKLALDLARRRLETQEAASSCPLPPGPPGLPFVGNVIGINTEAPWLTYTEWAKTYGTKLYSSRFHVDARLRPPVVAGDLVYTQLLGKHIVIVSSEKIAKDLLEYRSKNYSDRPFLVTNEL
jgi:hypothetical protein